MDKKKDKNQICISSEFLWIFLVIFILIIFGLYMFNIFPFNIDNSQPSSDVFNSPSGDFNPPSPPSGDFTNNGKSILGGVRIFKKK